MCIDQPTLYDDISTEPTPEQKARLLFWMDHFIFGETGVDIYLLGTPYHSTAMERFHRSADETGEDYANT